jgi:hypothetical protein
MFNLSCTFKVAEGFMVEFPVKKVGGYSLIDAVSESSIRSKLFSPEL